MTSSREWLKENAGESYPGIKFVKVGEVAIGTIESIRFVTTTDESDSGPAKTSEKMVVAMTILDNGKTTAHYVVDDPNVPNQKLDMPLVAGETYTLWVKPNSSLARAVAAACKAAEVDDLHEGGVLAIVHTELGEKKKGAFNPPKLYAGQYKAPERSVSINSLI